VDTFFRVGHQEEVPSDSLSWGGSSVVARDSNLSNFSANVIHDIQVL